MTQTIGVDFGTTNSVVASLQPDGSLRTATYPIGQRSLDVFRTVLCFRSETRAGRSELTHQSGPYAVQSYLDEPEDTRLIMSMKTYLAQPSFTRTNIFGRVLTLEQMVALFLGDLLTESAANTPVVAGRPVRFAGEFADDALGERRLRASFGQAGFARLETALEPEAAGYRFARTLDRPATVLVGDFGGGTSDFSVMRFDPAAAVPVAALGYAGIGVAGDVFDYRIIDKVVSPLLGKHDSYTVMGKSLPVPVEYFDGFARWHRLSLMRAPKTLRDIAEVAATSTHPARLRSLIRLIEEELGYDLYQAVSAAKAALSQQDTATLRFSSGDFGVDHIITRQDFEAWIAPDLLRLATTIQQALDAARLRADQIDRVFLTGGTSLVPAVRRVFTDRFGREKVSGGGEFVSVAEGLALIGRDREAGASGLLANSA